MDLAAVNQQVVRAQRKELDMRQDNQLAIARHKSLENLCGIDPVPACKLAIEAGDPLRRISKMLGSQVEAEFCEQHCDDRSQAVFA